MKIRLPKSRLIEVSKLRRNKSNVKLHPKGQVEGLAKLIEMVGFKDPIVIDKKLVVWAGHGRLDAAEHLGMKQVPCIDIDQLTISQKKAFMLMDNRINESDWNVPNVGLVLGEIPDFDFGEYHMDFGDMASIMEEEEVIPEPPKKPKAKHGDAYQLGAHKIMCGDATKDLDNLYNTKPDIVITDPPYGMNLDTDWTDAKSSLEFLKHTGASAHGNKYPRVINDDKPFDPTYLLKFKEVFLWGADYYKDKLPNDGSWFVWDKRLTEAFDRMYGSTFELCWSKVKHRREIIRVKWAGIFGTERQDVKGRLHPTQKPLEIPRFFIEKFSKENHIILDPYLGSGSTLIACEQTKRICYGMEIDPAYIDVIIKRWENFTGKKAVKV